MSGDSHGGGTDRDAGDDTGPRHAGRSRSPRAGLVAGPPRSHRPLIAAPSQSAMGPTPRGGGIHRGPAPGPPAAPPAQPPVQLPTAGAPLGASPALPASRAPVWPGAIPSGSATAAVLAQQLPLQQAAVAASQAARAAAAAVPGSLSPAASVTPSGASLAILEAQVASLGALLLALQGIVLQLIAVVNLMRGGI